LDVHAAGIEPLFFLLKAPSMAATAEKAQHEPHWPWSLTSVTTPSGRLSKESGTVTALLAWNEIVAIDLTRRRERPRTVSRYSSLVMSANWLRAVVKECRPAFARMLWALM